jgi:hypothetical protein
MPVDKPTDRELIEKIAADIAHLSAILAEWEPLLAAMRGGNGNGISYVRAAGLRRAMRPGRAAGKAD